MFGLKKSGEGYLFRVVSEAERLFLNLYRGERRVQQIEFDPGERIGNVWSLSVEKDLRGLSYSYEANGQSFSDPNGSVFTGRRHFGRLSDGVKLLKTPIEESLPAESSDWRADKPLNIPYEDSVIYRIHVRGFTKDSSSGVEKEKRGSFAGIIEKIPYLLELGVNGVELLPSYEFNEIMLRKFAEDSPTGYPFLEEEKNVLRPAAVPTGKINYWGFTEDALYLAPKASYSSRNGNPREEFRTLVWELHKNGIQVFLDLYFTEKALPDYISTVMRYWRTQFHIDGIHLIGRVPQEVIVRDPYLAEFKIWAEHWDGEPKGKRQNFLREYNDSFQNDMRRILKGDESMLRSLMEHIRGPENGTGGIHYMANESGFTLMDMLSYDRKHNEGNGENNQDGSDYNFSWNCGEEGASRKKGVKLLRKRMFRNAMLLLFLSQGTVLLNAGDEFGRSKGGNNNSYCQDNAVNWLDWRLLKKNRELWDFTKYLIAFRKQHRVFHQSEPLRGLDYRNKGIPDISFHGENAWRVDMENFRRQLGVMYAGAYAEDESFLVLYNLHWESHRFRLPHPENGKCWKLVLDSAEEERNGIFLPGEEKPIENGECLVRGRSIVVLQGFSEEKPEEKKARRKRAKAVSKKKKELEEIEEESVKPGMTEKQEV